MKSLVLIAATAVVGFTTALTARQSAAGSTWAHDWETPASAWWGYGAMTGGTLFDDETVAFAARNYKVVLLSLCGAGQLHTSAALGIMNVSARLKAVNPGVKVLQYFNVGQWACYDKDDADYVAFLAHPEWWLLDDTGSAVLTNGSPQYDWTNEAAVQHFLSMPLDISPHGTSLLDGFLFDGGAGYDQPANVSEARAEALMQAKWRALGRMQERLTDANGGLALANGMIGGPMDPNATSPAYNLGVLDYVNGVENERGTPAFELVDPMTGAFKKDAVAANLAAIETASQLLGGGKMVFVNYWAGPITGFHRGLPGDNSSGLPTFAPGDPSHHAPNGTRAQVMRGWQQMLTKWLPFNLASFLSVAGPGTYFSQSVWYAAYQGFAPCNTDPDSCCAPRPFYPMMHKQLGPPKGPRQQVGAYQWRREFEHAVVTLDLDDPLGSGTAVMFDS